MVFSVLISTFLQIVAFSIFPLLFYLIRKKKVKGFFDFIGLNKTPPKAISLALLTSLLFVAGGVTLALVSSDLREIIINPPSISGEIRMMGFNVSSVSILLITACLKTSLSEEILFRGFIAKRLIKILGFQTGNIIQALIFASVHIILFALASPAKLPFLIFIFLLSGLAGYLICLINEKTGDGSILPGWLAHALGNTVSYFILAFVV